MLVIAMLVVAVLIVIGIRCLTEDHEYYTHDRRIK